VKTIEVTDEQYEILRCMSAQMKIQDQRHTHLPLYCVRVKSSVYNLEAGEGDGCVYIGDDDIEYESEEALMEAWDDKDEFLDKWDSITEKQYDDYNQSGITSSDICDLTGLRESWYRDEYKLVNGQVFFTLEGAQAHIDSNRHHYNEPDVYTVGAWRNPEMETLLDVVMGITNPGEKAHR
jgi:hypothetical protein